MKHFQNFYSEFGEDQWVFENVSVPASGVYVDVGCASPGKGNNTEFLREFSKHWTGLVIDANGSYRKSWEGQRGNPQFVEAVIAPPDRNCFWEYPDKSVSRAVTLETAQAMTGKSGGFFRSRRPDALNDVLRQHQIKSVDILSLDLEGGEYDALQTFSMVMYRPNVIISEYRSNDTGIDYRAMEYLLATGRYILAHQTHANQIFVRKNMVKFQ